MRRRSIRLVGIKLVVALVSTLAALCAGEFAYRATLSATPRERADVVRLRALVAGGSGRYTATAHTSYGLTPGANVNSFGFHGAEWTREPEPGVTRIICLGGSTTEGGNSAGVKGSYPYLLEQGLAANLKRPVEVLNCGVSAWTSAESLVTWFLLMQDYQADFVIMHNVVNDVMPRHFPDYRRNYSHWRTAWRAPEFGFWDGWMIRLSDFYAMRRLDSTPTALDLSVKPRSGPIPLDESGDLLPDTSAAYRRNLISIGESVTAHGGVFCLMTMPTQRMGDRDTVHLGVEEHNRIMRELAQEHGWLLIDAARAFPAFPGYSVEAFYIDRAHLTVEGNVAKAMLAGLAIAPML